MPPSTTWRFWCFDSARVWAEFEASTAHQLQAGARLTLSVKPVDGQISVVTMIGSWREPSVDAEWTRLTTLRSCADDLSNELESILYELVANAMAHPDPVPGTPIRLG